MTLGGLKNYFCFRIASVQRFWTVGKGCTVCVKTGKGAKREKGKKNILYHAPIHGARGADGDKHDAIAEMAKRRANKAAVSSAEGRALITCDTPAWHPPADTAKHRGRGVPDVVLPSSAEPITHARYALRPRSS